MSVRGTTPPERLAPRRRRKPRQRLHLDQGVATVTAAAIGIPAAIIGALAAWWLAGLRAPDRAPALPPPRFSITSPQPGAHIGSLATVSGTAENLQPGQMVWILTQPYAKDGTPTTLYFPLLGPCPVSAQGVWACRIRVGSAADRGQEFAVWAAVVTDAQAYADARLVALPAGSHRYFNYAQSSDLPHATGTRPFFRVVIRSLGGP